MKLTKEIFRAAAQTQPFQEAGSRGPGVAERLRKLRLVRALRLAGISRSTHPEWEKRLRTEGLRGLQPGPKRPKGLRRKVHGAPAPLEEPPPGAAGPSGSACARGVGVRDRTVGRILAHPEAQGRVEGVASCLALCSEETPGIPSSSPGGAGADGCPDRAPGAWRWCSLWEARGGG